MKNRLHLDYSITTNADRSAFVNEYILQKEFQSKPLTEQELETIANYILYGVDPETNQNDVQQKFIEIKTKSGTWDNSKETSLDGLLDSPNFTESMLRINVIPTHIKKEVFSREEAKNNAQLAEQLTPLWRRIDTLDLIINFYEIKHNRRNTNPRSQLIEQFSATELEDLKEKANHLNQFQYLKMRHLLVEMRREQYTIRDQFKDEPHQLRTQPIYGGEIDEDLRVMPLGLMNEERIGGLMFGKDLTAINPNKVEEKDLNLISNFIWAKEEEKQNHFVIFDFEQEDHLFNLITNKDVDEEDPIWKTFKFYVDNTVFTDAQSLILKLKCGHYKNSEIAATVNETCGTTYTDNYISTIFRQKILPKLAATARMHRTIFENIFFAENFKQCSCCGKWFLINADNFVRKARSVDGFSNKCKLCDKLGRQARKEAKL